MVTHRQRRESGFSVVELMVSMTISLLLLAGVLSVMYTSRITYDENARVSRLQEYARASVELMLRDLRSAGNLGCARPIRPQQLPQCADDTGITALQLRPTRSRALRAAAGVWAPAMDAAQSTPRRSATAMSL